MQEKNTLRKLRTGVMVTIAGATLMTTSVSVNADTVTPLEAGVSETASVTETQVEQAKTDWEYAQSSEQEQRVVVDNLSDSVVSANQEVVTIEAQIAEAPADVTTDSVQESLSYAETVVETAKENVTVKEEAYTSKKEEVDAQTVVVAEAQANVTRDSRKVEDAQTKFDNLTGDVDVDSIQEQISELESTVESEKAQVEQAEKALEAGKLAEENQSKALSTARDGVSVARGNYDEADSALQEAKAQEQSAKSALEKAQQDVDAVGTTRTETRQVGTKLETVQTGTKTETVQTGTKTEKVQTGTKTETVQTGTKTEQVQTGTKTSTKYVGMETVQEQTGTEIQRVKVGEEEVQVQVGTNYETKVVGTKTKTEIVGYKTEQVKVGERTVTEGGKAGLKDGTATYSFSSMSKNDGIPVSDNYIKSIKALASGTGSVSEVLSAIKDGEITTEVRLSDGRVATSTSQADITAYVGGATDSGYRFFYNNHKYALANSDTTTKHDVLDLPYEVRKDLALFYVSLVNDLRSKVGTEPLKVTEESLQQAYNVVNDLRVISFESVDGDKSYLEGVSRSQLEEKGYFTNSIREKTVISDTGRGILQEGTNLSNKYNADLYSLVYSGEGNASRDFENPRYQTVDQLKYGIISVLGQQIYGFEGKGYNGQEGGGVNGARADNFKTALAILGLDGNTNNTVGFDVSLYKSDSRGNQDKYSQVMITFSNSSATAITNPYETSTGGTTRVEDVYETRETPIYETKTVDVTERVEVPVYRTQVRDIYEDREVPTYTNVTRPKYETVEEPVYETVVTPVYEIVETPIYTTVETPVYSTIETPTYETREVPVYEEVEVAVSVPQALVDALNEAKANYEQGVSNLEKAQEAYNTARERLQTAQLNLSNIQTNSVDLAQLESDVISAKAKFESDTESLNSLKSTLEVATQSNRQVALARAEALEELNKSLEDLATSESVLSKEEETLKVLQENLYSANAELVKAQDDLTKAEEVVTSLKETVANIKSVNATNKENLEALKLNLEQAKSKVTSLEEELTKAQAVLTTRKEDTVTKLQEYLRLKALLENQESENKEEPTKTEEVLEKVDGIVSTGGEIGIVVDDKGEIRDVVDTSKLEETKEGVLKDEDGNNYVKTEEGTLVEISKEDAKEISEGTKTVKDVVGGAGASAGSENKESSDNAKETTKENTADSVTTISVQSVTDGIVEKLSTGSVKETSEEKTLPSTGDSTTILSQIFGFGLLGSVGSIVPNRRKKR